MCRSAGEGGIIRKLIVLTGVLLASSSAQAQYTLEQMMQVGYQACVSQGGAPRFCDCYVRRWVGLWTPEDSQVWRATGQATPHMRAMEAVARQQCGG
ncbi:MAG TPA: hypothetical protein VMI56_04475 [Reyranella sp.]|nr:hypothetical protein [Reyranella sp.]